MCTHTRTHTHTRAQTPHNPSPSSLSLSLSLTHSLSLSSLSLSLPLSQQHTVPAAARCASTPPRVKMRLSCRVLPKRSRARPAFSVRCTWPPLLRTRMGRWGAEGRWKAAVPWRWPCPEYWSWLCPSCSRTRRVCTRMPRRSFPRLRRVCFVFALPLSACAMHADYGRREGGGAGCKGMGCRSILKVER